ncbi:AMP-binding protein [Pseudoalteromonas sp. MMG022]|uniref:AMP-binding protein n=1 Tax=Pseudoalteromonas sp. MMG022 TaxID=2909978 RepID=UPI001F3AA795|nr:AMP-binding protein [Pseudoalteromonas sp. MMG022]MCF6436884.1 AMP-binding protein [Pseudoalteromonas sp. MMG022]
MNMLVEQLQKSPEQVVLLDSEKSITSAELTTRATEISDLIGTQQLSCVAFRLDNSIAWVVLDLALTMTDSATLPLPTFFTHAQCEFAMHKAGAQWLISDQAESNLAMLTTLNIFGQTLWIYELQGLRTTELFPDTQKITFTSGSTGEPKGCCLSLSSQFTVASSLCERVALPAPKHLCVLPLGVLLENIAGIYAPLLSGGQVKVLSAEELGFIGSQVFDYQLLLNAITQYEPNSLVLVPEILKILILAAEQGWLPPKSLQFVAVGGALVSRQMLNRASALGIPVHQGYGLSEACSVVSLNTDVEQDGSVGKPLAHIQFKAIDNELYIRGPLFLGYLNEQPHDETHWYATGDLVTIEQRDLGSSLSIIGRKKHVLINSFGRNVSPEWPESLLQNTSWPIQVVVCGEARAFLSALVWMPQTISDEQFEQHLVKVNQSLPDYARVLRWHRLSKPLSIEQGLLSNNMRPKRAAIADFYVDVINGLYLQ